MKRCEKLIGEMQRMEPLRVKQACFRGGGWDARGAGCQLESLVMRD